MTNETALMVDAAAVNSDTSQDNGGKGWTNEVRYLTVVREESND